MNWITLTAMGLLSLFQQPNSSDQSIEKPSDRYFNAMENATHDEFVKEFETPFLFVLEEEEMDDYCALDAISVKKSYIKDYITRKDENPVSPVNNWYTEFSERVIFAKSNYGLENPPYFDDRGKFYIRYGQPSRKYTDPGGTQRQDFLALERTRGTAGSSGRIVSRTVYPDDFYTTKPSESWAYDIGTNKDFSVYFADEGYFKEAEYGLRDLLVDGKRPSDMIWYWMDMVRERSFLSRGLSRAMLFVNSWEFPNTISLPFPDDGNATTLSIENQVYLLEYEENTRKRNARPNLNTRFTDFDLIDFDIVTAQFKAENNNTRLKVVTYTDPNEIRQFSPPELNLEMEYLLRDQDFEEMFRDKTEDVFTNFEEVNSIFLTSETSVSPNNGDITVQLMNTDTKEIGFEKSAFTIKDFSSEELMMSDVLFYTRTDALSPQREVINEISVEPYPTWKIDKNVPLLIYFEVYNMLQHPDGSPYNVELTLRKDKSGDNAIKKFGSFLTGSGGMIHSMQSRVVASAPDTKELIGFDLNGIKEGTYVLTVSVSPMWDKDVKTFVQRRFILK